MQIKAVFYKDNYKWWSRLIKWWTNSKYSHCELYINDELIGISTEQRVRKKKQVLNINKWDVFLIDHKKVDIRKIEEFYNKTQGAKYDWLGILYSNIFNRRKHSNLKYTCSEWLLECLDFSTKDDLIFPKKYIQYSPYETFEILKTKGILKL